MSNTPGGWTPEQRARQDALSEQLKRPPQPAPAPKPAEETK